LSGWEGKRIKRNRKRILVILDFLEASPTEWTPSTLAKELNMPPGTIRWNLKNLLKQRKVIYRKVGKYHFYSATKQFSDDFERMLKIHPATERYEIHGLTMKINGKFSNILSLGGMSLSRGVSRWNFEYRGRRVSFQLSRETLMVYCDCGEDPMDYDSFIIFLSMVDGYLQSKYLPTFLDNLDKWMIVQYGLNKDWKKFRVDGMVKAVSLKGFEMWFARVYEKESLSVVREEVHSREVKSIEQMISVMSGSITMTQLVNLFDLTAKQIMSLQSRVGELVKRVDRQQENQERILRLLEKAFDTK